MKLSAKQILAFGGVVIAGFVVFAVVRAARAAPGAAIRLVDPTDPGNVINRFVNNVGDALDDAERNQSFSIGSFIFDLFNPEFDPNAPTEFTPEVEQSVRGKNDRQRIFVPPATGNQTASPNPPIQGAEI